MTAGDDSAGYLTGQLLVAMPQMEDSRFVRSVIYLCAIPPRVRWGSWSTS